MAQFESLGINEKFEEMAQICNEIAQMAEKLARESHMQFGKKYAFPIDIELVAKYLGMSIIKEKLNPDGAHNLSRKLAIIMSTKVSAKAEDVRIVVDNTVSYKTQRFAIANCIGRYLLNQSRGMYKNTYAIPLIPQNLEEIAADSIALFLLMPVTLFKEEFLQYLNGCDQHPLDVDDWLEHLSDTCQITPFNLAIGYQQMKQVLCYQRQAEFAEHDFDITHMPEDKYSKIFA